MPEFISHNPKEYHVWWDSTSEMERELPKLTKRANDGQWELKMMMERREISSEYWTGTKGGNHEAIEKCRNGWPELLPRLATMITALKKRVDLAAVEAVTVQVRRRKRIHCDYGDTLDIHRVWNGQLDKAWERPVRRNIAVPTQRYATIYIDLAMSGGDSFSSSLWRAAEACCIYELLNRMGINTEVWCGSSHIFQFETDLNRRSWKGVRIKEYTQPLNDETLALMSSAAFHRTLGWRMSYAAPWRVRNLLGTPYQQGMVKPLRERAEQGERVFRIGNCFSEEQAANDLGKAIEILRKEYGGSREVA